MYGFTNSRTAAFQQSPSKAALPLSAKSGHWLAARNRPFVVVRRSAGIVLSAFSPAERAGASGPRDQAGTYVNLITFSPIGSLATRRSGDGGLAKNGLPRPRHDGVEVQSILVNQTKRGQASRQVWSTKVNLASEFGLEQPPPRPRRL